MRISDWSSDVCSSDLQRFCDRLARAMERRGFTVETAYTVADGLAVAHRLAPRYAVVDLRLDDGSGLEVVQALREARDDARVIEYGRALCRERVCQSV